MKLQTLSEVNIERDGYARLALIRFPGNGAQRVVQQRGQYSTMHNSRGIGVLLFG